TRARDLAGRINDPVSFLAGPARLPSGFLDNGDRTPITVHRFCQSGNILGQGDEMERLISDLTGVPIVPLPENGVCCGFGGSTSLTAPEVAAGVLRRTLECADRSAETTLVTDNPWCVLHIPSCAHQNGR